jgi:DNA repair protein RadC
MKLAAMLAAGYAIVPLGVREVVRSRQVDSNDPSLHKYLLAQFSGLKEEHLLVLFLDESHRLLSEERYTSGSTGFLSLRPRKLFSRALALGCHAIVLAHNHPSGDPNPSQNDIDATRRVAVDASFLVIGRSQVTSMLRGGLI